MANLHIESFYHQGSQTFCHLLVDLKSSVAALIDPVQDYAVNSGGITHDFMLNIIEKIEHHNWRLDWILETHVHADHLSGAQFVKRKLGGQVAISRHVKDVQHHFDGVFALDSEIEALFDVLVSHGQTLALGDHSIEVLETPGHTPACLTYVVEDKTSKYAFIGDTLFMPDVGTARCDFPGGSAEKLYDSIMSIYALGDSTDLYICHDYPPDSREAQHQVSVKEQTNHNVHCASGISKSQFVKIRQARDATLAAPRLILPSLQVNIRAGFLPTADEKGRRFMRTPVKSPVN